MRCGIQVEALEKRRLCAVDLEAGVLRVELRGQHVDEIVATQGKGQIVLTVNGRERRFAASAVKRMIVDSGAGDDRVNLKRVSVRVKVYGGSGKDRIEGGRGDDLLFGEEGQDKMNGNGGDDFVNGGGGEDLLLGGAGDDHLEGHAENDTLRGGAGNDRLDAVDYLWEDLVFGDEGFDIADIDDGIPTEDFDTEEDDVAGVEEVHEIDNPYLDD